jgi:DNA-binding NarL/FixJ family response regulator
MRRAPSLGRSQIVKKSGNWLAGCPVRESMRLILADGQELFREGVKRVLSQCDYVEVVGEAGDADALIDLLQRVTAEAVMVDLGMSAGDDAGLVERVLETFPGVMMVVLARPADHLNGRVRKAIELGSQGCLLKNTSSEELVTALRIVAEGHYYIQGQLLPMLVNGGREGHRDRLSPRHLTILQYVADGLSNQEIATLVGVSETTLKSRLRVIYGELDAATRVEAVATALREGLVD